MELPNGAQQGGKEVKAKVWHWKGCCDKPRSCQTPRNAWLSSAALSGTLHPGPGQNPQKTNQNSPCALMHKTHPQLLVSPPRTSNTGGDSVSGWFYAAVQPWPSEQQAQGWQWRASSPGAWLPLTEAAQGSFGPRGQVWHVRNRIFYS